MQRGDDNKINVRLEDGMRHQLKEAAKSNGRSLNAEVVARLSGTQANLRDQFAMAALSGLLASPIENHPQGLGFEVVAAHYSETAYKYADAMLAAREGGDQS